jgi:DNA-binding transcriptional ArsR family regulator
MSNQESDPVFDKAAGLFGLMSNPTRLKIVCLLCDGERNVTELRAEIAGAQPTISQHLSVLYRSGMLDRRRVGAQLYYRIASAQLDMLCEVLRQERNSVSPSAAKPAA